MASKNCPVCGKKIAAQAQYCIFCSTKFDSVPEKREERTKKTPDSTVMSGGKLGLMVTVISVAIIACVLLLVFFNPPQASENTSTQTTTTVVTTTTRNAQRDAWLQSFTGQWLDEPSAGKGDLRKQGGYILIVRDIINDTVCFDLMSYPGDNSVDIAFLNEYRATLEEDTLHFTFEDDGRGHSGEGFMRFCDDGVQMEVRVPEEELSGEGDHSLAVYAVFVRKSLPSSAGHDLKTLTTLSEVEAVAGKQTADATTDKKGNTTYTFGALRIVTDDKANVKQLILDYAALEDKSFYCYECVDGTMSYDTIKTYFGEAVQDYIEQPTDIRVLLYEDKDNASVKFTFDADDNLLFHIEYKT